MCVCVKVLVASLIKLHPCKQIVSVNEHCKFHDERSCVIKWREGKENRVRHYLGPIPLVRALVEHQALTPPSLFALTSDLLLPVPPLNIQEV